MVFVNYLVGILLIGLFWGLVSYLAYHLSVVLKKMWPLGVIAGISMVFSWLYSISLFIWFIFTTIAIFSDGNIIFGIIFLLFLGGIITGFAMTIFNLIASIPVVLMGKLEERLEDEKA